MNSTQKMRLIPEEKYQAMLKAMQDKAAFPENSNTENATHVAETNTQEDEKEMDTTPSETSQKFDVSQGKLTNQEILINVPKSYRSKARKLLKFISEHENSQLDWDNNGQIIYKGEIIPNTSIYYLIKDAVAPYKDFTPLGATEFYDILSEMNVPKTLIQNKNKTEQVNLERLPPPGIRTNHQITAESNSTPKSAKPWEKLF